MTMLRENNNKNGEPALCERCAVEFYYELHLGDLDLLAKIKKYPQIPSFFFHEYGDHIDLCNTCIVDWAKDLWDMPRDAKVDWEAN